MLLAAVGCVLVSYPTIDAMVRQYASPPGFPPSNPVAVEILRVEPARPHECLSEEVPNRLQPVGTFVSGPWCGRDVDVIKGRKVVGVAIKYRR
jgi:hypothetical protein